MSELLLRDKEALPDFEFVECIGTSQAETWSALERSTGKDAIVKIYRFEHASDWKGLDLFRREIIALKQLQHHGIPRYLAHREVELDGQLHVYLVQARVQGETLENLAQTSADELRNIARGVLEILAYLQSFSPPIIHRDVKPANIMVEENGAVHLVDFGAVQLITPADEGGSTIVGTSGYMPFEQLMGRSSPASDLFGLGMTLVWLMTRTHPDSLPVVDMRVVWEKHLVIPVHDDFRQFVKRLTEPVAEDRYADANEALHALERGPSLGLAVRRPDDTHIEIIQKPNELRFVLPPRSLAFLAISIAITVLCAIVLFRFLPPVGGLMLILMIGGGTGHIIYREYHRAIELRILPDRWQLRGRYHIINEGTNEHLIGIGRGSGEGEIRPMNVVTRRHSVPVFALISEDEERWLNASFQAFLARH